MNEPDLETASAVARRVVESLDQGTRQLEPSTLASLYGIRRKALSAVHARHMGQGVLALTRHPIATAVMLAAIVAAALWFSQGQPRNKPSSAPDTSALDIQLLTGEVPPQVFADWSLVTQENIGDVCLTTP